jgi:hypothetical protein
MTKPYFRNTPNWVGNYSFNQEQILTINNFGGGMNNVDADTVIADNEATDTKNMMFVSGSLMQTRYGTVYVDEVTYPNIVETNIVNGNAVTSGVPITWVDEFKPTIHESKYVVATDKEIYIGGVKICDVEGQVHGVNYMGRYYFVDGKSIRVWDGTNYYKVIEQPSAKLTAATSANSTTLFIDNIPPTIAVGNPINIITTTTTYTSTISAIDVENKKITCGTAITGALPEEQIILFFTPFGTSITQGEEVWIDATHYVYYNPCLNEISDTYQGLSYIPDSPNVITVHKNRIFLAGDSTQPHGVYMSFANQPLYFPVNAGVAVKPNGDKIIDLIVFDNALVIGRHNDMYVLYGSTEYTNQDDAFRIQQMDVSIGFMCTDCGAMINNYYIYMGYDGRFYKLNTPTTYVDYLMTKPLDWKIDIYNEPFNISKSEKINISTAAYSNEVYFTINSNLTLVYNYDNQAWTYYTNSFSNSRYTDGLVMIIRRSDGKLVKFDTSGTVYSDLGVAIEAKYSTKKFDLNASANYKYFKKFMITSEAFDNFSSNINVSAEIDFFYTRGAGYIIESNKSRFGSAKFGDIFNNKNLHKSGWLNLDVRGRTIKFTFENNNINEPFRIYDINVLHSGRDVR